jgi:predicted phage tail protein
MGVAYESDAANSADNARSMNNTAAITAAFRGAGGGSAATPSAPAAPSQLQANMPDAEQAQLSWRDNASDETGFMLQRAVNGGSFSDRASLATNTTGFTDTGLAAGTTYSYRVRAWSSVGNSDFSNTVTIVTPASTPSVPLAPPPAPPSPASVSPAAEVATVSWVDVAGENAYEARRETLHPKNGRWNATTLSIPADVTSFAESLNAGTYRYAVRALNASGSSEWVTAQCSGCGSDGSFEVTSSGGSSGGPGSNKGGKKK